MGTVSGKLEDDEALRSIIGKRVIWAGFVGCPGLGYCEAWGDHDHVLIVFDDGSILLLTSEDYEGYASSIYASLYSDKYLRELKERLEVDINLKEERG